MSDDVDVAARVAALEANLEAMSPEGRLRWMKEATALQRLLNAIADDLGVRRISVEELLSRSKGTAAPGTVEAWFDIVRTIRQNAVNTLLAQLFPEPGRYEVTVTGPPGDGPPRLDIHVERLD